MRSFTVLGPVPTDEGDAFIPLLLVDGAPPELLEAADSLDGALFAVRRRLPPGPDVVADETLGGAALKHGWRLGPLPELLRALVAAAAVSMHSEGAFGRLTDGQLVADLLVAIADFAKAAPWRRFVDVVLPGRATGPGNGAFACTILGSEGNQHGLVVYDAPGGHDRFLRLLDAGVKDAAEHVDATTCLLDFDGGFAARAMQAAFGVAVSVVVVRMKNARPQPLRPDDARRLAATLRAVTSVAEDGATGNGASMDGRVTVSLDVGELPAAGGREVLGDLPRLQPHPIHAVDRALTVKLVDFARAHVPGFVMPASTPDADFEVFLRTNLQPFDGQTVLQRFLATQAPTPEERSWLEARASARLSVWEVEASDGSDELALVDALDGRRVVVRDVSSAERLRHREALLAPVASWDGQHLLLANQPYPLGPRRLRAVLEALSPSPAPPLDFEAARRLASAWAHEAQGPSPALSRGAGLRTTDGERFAPTTDTWVLARGGRKHVVAALNALDGLSREVDTSAQRWTWTKRGNAEHPDWWRTVLADLSLTRDELVVSASSVERLDALRPRLETAFGSHARHARRTPQPLPPAFAALDVSVDAQPASAGPWLPVMQRQHLFDAAGDASASDEERDRLHTQACELEFHEARTPDEADDDLADDGGKPEAQALAFRRLTGVASDGRFVGRDTLWLAMGAGTPLGLLLQALVAPLMNELPGDPAVQLRDATRLAWAAWNAVRTHADDAAAMHAARRQLAVDEAPAPVKQDKAHRRGRKSAHLAPALEQRDPALLEDALAWLLAAARRGAKYDHRVVLDVTMEGKGSAQRVAVLWAMPQAYDERLRALGYEAGGPLPMTAYDDTFDPLEHGFAWRAVAPPWRAELVAAWYRELQEPFDGDFRAQVDAHTALLDAVVDGTAPGLRDAWEALRDSGLDDLDVAQVLVDGVRHVDGLSLTPPGPRFREGLERFVARELDELEAW